MDRLRLGHIGLHVESIEVEASFLELLVGLAKHRTFLKPYDSNVRTTLEPMNPLAPVTSIVSAGFTIYPF